VNFSEATSVDEEEQCFEEWPTSMWLQSLESSVYQEFLGRNQSLPALVPILPKFRPSDTGPPPPAVKLEFGRPFVCLETPSTVLQGRR
jgi:hypothetical protein